jgi:hypothetical protein
MKIHCYKLSRLALVLSSALAALTSSLAQADKQFVDDLVVTGSICAGFDCANGENFNFDTIRLKENNLRIKFIDTSSSSSFPTIDWEMVVNDSANGGLNRFSIAEVDSGLTPFTILQSAPNHSIFVTAAGNIGMGTSSPLMQLHIVESNSPTIRFHQDNGAGFAEQIWDIGGNETNFFIRDVSNNGGLPFRLSPNAPNSSIHVAADGDVGFETSTPDGQFDVAHASNANNHAFFVSPTSAVGVNIDNGFLPLGIFDVQTTGGLSRLTVQADGDVGVGTANPAGRFEVRNLANDKSFFDVDASGNVGIGTNAQTKRLDIRNVANDKTVFTVSDSGHLTVGTDTPVTYSIFEPQIMLSAPTDINNSISINAVGPSASSALVFAHENTFKWMLNSRNTRGGANDSFIFYNSKSDTVLALTQDGKIGFGLSVVSATNEIQHSNGASLTTGGVWTNGSSRTLKKDILDISLKTARDALQALNPVTFSYKLQPDETYAGFIAEDVPDVVATNDRKGLAAMDIVAVLTKVLQDQQKTISGLNDRLALLEESKAKQP